MIRKYMCVLILLLIGCLKVHSIFADDPILNIKGTYPQIISSELGYCFEIKGGAGIMLSIEPGLKGSKAHIGYRSTTSLSPGAYSTNSLTCSYLYMQNDLNKYLKNEKYVGIEAATSIFNYFGFIGIMKNTDKKEYHLTIGIGYEFF